MLISVLKSIPNSTGRLAHYPVAQPVQIKTLNFTDKCQDSSKSDPITF